MSRNSLGARRHLLILESRSIAPDGLGGFSEEWSAVDDLPQIYASIHDVGGGRPLRGPQITLATTHRIRTAFTTHIRPGMQLVSSDDRIYSIEAVLDPSGLREYLEILAISEI